MLKQEMKRKGQSLKRTMEGEEMCFKTTHLLDH